MSGLTKPRWHSATSIYARVHFAQKDLLGECWYCGVPLDVYDTTCLTLNARTIDHVIPKSLGGEDTRANRVWSCLRCNREKADLLPDEGILEPLGIELTITDEGIEVQYSPHAKMWPLRPVKGSVQWR